jgi:hypothetical protein
MPIPNGGSGNEDETRQWEAWAMSVSTEDLMDIAQTLDAADADSKAFATLRQRFPHLFFTQCDASDMAEEPYRTCDSFEMHLLDGSNHCVEITSDPTRATGIILAKRTRPS